jgi:cleaved adhesin domain-containing protein/type IX secretion system substrate protein
MKGSLMRQFFVFLLILSLCTGAVFADNQKMVALPQSNVTKYYPTNAIENLKSVKWEETFNSTTIPAGWQVIDNDGSGAAWEYRQLTVFTSGDTVYPQIDSSYWFSSFNNANGLLIDEWLISPKVAGIAAGDSLHIWAGAIDGTWKDSLKVWVSTTDSALGSFTQVGYFKVDGPLGVNNWTKYSFDLSSFAGNDIFIAANYYITNGGTSGSASDNMWLDHFAVTEQSNNVTVHFRANTASVPDTLGITSTVQIRGSGSTLTWGADSPVFLTNEGSSDQWGSSDYWYGSAQFPAGDTIFYKFFTNSHDTVYAGAPWEGEGWEANSNDPSGNRVLDLAGFMGTDTVIDVQFVNGYDPNGAPQYGTPYTTNDSTFVVYFRVNVQGFKLQGFDATQHKLGIRGSNTDDWGQTGELGWGTTYLLTPEDNHANGGSQQYDGDNFYSGAVHFPMQYIDDGVQWKFVVHFLPNPLDEDWGNMFWNPGLEENVQFTHTTIEDTTLYWRWYDHFTPAGGVFGDTVEITFQADMSTAIANNGFTPGDTALAISGWNLTGGDVYRSGSLIKQGFTNIYASTDTVATNLGEDYQYNYYVIKDGIEYREIFYDFTDPAGGSSAEKRKVNITSSPLTVLDDSDDPISLRRKPSFRNLATPSQDVNVYFTCDLRPAYYQVLQGDTLVAIQGGAIFDVSDPDSVYSWGVRINGPASGGWGSWGIPLRDDTTGRMMYDDGTHGDEVAGDTIFTADAFTYFAHLDSNDIVGQEFKFGVAGGDNEGGYGNNHIENIDDSTPTSYLRSQFGSIDPIFYWAWDFQNQTPNGIGDENLALPKKFALYQNFPNPFNPSTNIKFDLPNQTDVKLVIYNILGQQVVTLIDDNLKPGDYAKTWNGLDQHGSRVATGVYFYKLVTNEHTAVKKLLMVK